MPVRRGYRQACGTARGLDIVGERWALLVVRELLLGPKRFTDLQAALPAASPNALADRLRELTDAGVLRRGALPPPASAKVYELTDWGRRLEPIVIALGTWALEAPPTDDQIFVSTDSAMLTIRTYYAPPVTNRAAATNHGADAAENANAGPNAGAGGDASIRIELYDHGAAGVFGVRLTSAGAEVAHAVPDAADAVVRTTTAELLAAFGRHALPPAGDAATSITGDRSVVRRLVEGIRVPADDRESGTMGIDDAD
ncbi:transcriptional regulator [Kribbella pittospori]|uniref:Transcriptional regulator n=1 Tax=Kribbella pittospori TaxID=722689 RepID=A0A4R0L0U2_9ACTN|nr:helix-turn-helix domain-containing protein [Kribbella pittospori]TCC62145.1 transcriptional regulator [Kribbella pittospori]